MHRRQAISGARNWIRVGTRSSGDSSGPPSTCSKTRSWPVQTGSGAIPPHRESPASGTWLITLSSIWLLPERPYTKHELRTYLQHCRKKCRETMVDLTEDQAHRSCQWGSLDLSFAELLLYNMRHVQHHAAQLNLLLRQNIDSAPPWVKRTQSERPPGSPQGA